jgi:hypothetical protein
MAALVVPRFIDDFTLWHEVKNRILNPTPNRDARVVCPICKDKQLTIVGIGSPLTWTVDRDGPGIVTPCGHMFCADCWKDHEANTKDLEESRRELDDGGEALFACPVCWTDLHFPACLCPFAVNKLPTPADYQIFVEENGPSSLASYLQREAALTFPELGADRPERCFTCFRMQFDQFTEILEYLVRNALGHLAGPTVAAYFQSASSNPDAALAVIVHAHNIHRNLIRALKVSIDWQCPCAKGCRCEGDHRLQTMVTVVDLKFPACPPTYTLRITMNPFPRADDGWTFYVDVVDDASGASVQAASVYVAVPTAVADPRQILEALHLDI